ncbi:3-hydroxyacyl-CoA dehydrogenase family protein [Streptomyces luomodiensis]|uniref:3-hydroxyacyl-CoA dehydrogenase family protein n=1 Tax=Streptomyces luomodiensis TaxID=3026192 RepID=A0ABY9VEE8_9ACTN|nr:3-hydroxyacyl-CoA dehydrogenase family protein [Streptomyces sp. SCA4-21]WNF00300.1 3-hydroxyacyl-CoA dehydrogenase family protein [Streptomyces sp. SCA4-21]
MTSAAHEPQDRALVVLGAGVMGVGITTLALAHGVPVTLVDTAEGVLPVARGRIREGLRMAQLMGALPEGVTTGELTEATAPAEVDWAAGPVAVIEAITEDAELKAKVLAEVAPAVAPGTPLISNTSSIPIDELAGAIGRPEDLLGTHFMNPSYLIPTVELIRGPRTGETALGATRELLGRLRRKVILVNDAPGFVTSRVLHPMINDAARVVEEGTASVEDVDALMQGCLGHPTGPLRTADLIGIDNLVDSLWVLYRRTGDEGCRPCELLLSKVRDGHHGRKSGRGFYTYERAM